MLCPASLGAIFYSEPLHILGRSNLTVERVAQTLYRMLESLFLLSPVLNLLIVLPLGHSLHKIPEGIDLHIL